MDDETANLNDILESLGISVVDPIDQEEGEEKGEETGKQKIPDDVEENVIAGWDLEQSEDFKNILDGKMTVGELEVNQDEASRAVDALLNEDILEGDDPNVVGGRTDETGPQPFTDDEKRSPLRTPRVNKSKEEDEKAKKKKKKEKRKRRDEPKSEENPDNVGGFLIGSASKAKQDKADDKRSKKEEKGRKDHKGGREKEKKEARKKRQQSESDGNPDGPVDHLMRSPSRHRKDKADEKKRERKEKDSRESKSRRSKDREEAREKQRKLSRSTSTDRVKQTQDEKKAAKEALAAQKSDSKKRGYPSDDESEISKKHRPLSGIRTKVRSSKPKSRPSKPKSKPIPDDARPIEDIKILRMNGKTFLRIFKDYPNEENKEETLTVLSRKFDLRRKKPILFPEKIKPNSNTSMVSNAAAGARKFDLRKENPIIFPKKIKPNSNTSMVSNAAAGEPAVQPRNTTSAPLQQEASRPAVVMVRPPGSGTTMSTSTMTGLKDDRSRSSFELPPSFHKVNERVFTDAVRLVLTREGKSIKVSSKQVADAVGIGKAVKAKDGKVQRKDIQVELEMENTSLETMLKGFEYAPFHKKNLTHIKQSISCPKCNKVYVSPKALRCMHMICMSCSTNNGKLIRLDSSYDTWKCEKCSKTTDFDKWGLLSCFFMTEKARFLYSILDIRNPFRCTNHPNDKKLHMLATVRCKQCQHDFCEACFKWHSNQNVGHTEFEWLGNHFAHREEYDPPQKITCKRHENQEVGFFCQRCNIAFCDLCQEIHHHHGVQKFGPKLKYMVDMKKNLAQLENDSIPKALQRLDQIERKLQVVGKYYRFKKGEGKEVVNELKTHLQNYIDKSWEPIRSRRQPEWQMNKKRYRNIQIDIQRRFIFIKRLREIGTHSEVMILTKKPFLQITQQLMNTASKGVFNPCFQGFHLLNPEVKPILNVPTLEYPFLQRVKVIDAMGDTSKPIHSIAYMNGDLVAVHFDEDPDVVSSYYLYCKSKVRQDHWNIKLKQCPKLYKVAFFQKNKTIYNETTEKLLALECNDRKDPVHCGDFEVAQDETSHHWFRAMDVKQDVEDYCTNFGVENYKPTMLCALKDEGYVCFTKKTNANAEAIIVRSPFMTKDKMNLKRIRFDRTLLSDPCAACRGPHQQIMVVDKSTNKIMVINNLPSLKDSSYSPAVFEDIEILDMCSSDTYYMVLGKKKDDQVLIKYNFYHEREESRLTRADGLEHAMCMTLNNDDETIYVGCDDGKIREFKFPKYRGPKPSSSSTQCCTKNEGYERVAYKTQTPI